MRRPAGNLEAFVQFVVRTRVHVAVANGDFFLRIEDDDVRVRTHGDGSLLWINAEELGWICRNDIEAGNLEVIFRLGAAHTYVDGDPARDIRILRDKSRLSMILQDGRIVKGNGPAQTVA